MHDFTPVSALVGGMIIGISASLFLLTHGRVAGISGLFGGVLRAGSEDRTSRLAFVLGLFVAGVMVRMFFSERFATTWSAPLGLALAAGVLVGIGTQLGNGCTSGHGVCGLSRFSLRSLVATLTFMLTAGVTVFVVRHVVGGGR